MIRRSGIRIRGSTATLPEGWKISSTVNEGEDGHFIGCDPIDQSVAFDRDLADIRRARFRHDPPSLGQSAQQSGGGAGVSDQGGCVVWGIAGDELSGRCQIAGRRFRPPYTSSHLAIRWSNSSSERVRPASTSSKPWSIFWRT